MTRGLLNFFFFGQSGSLLLPLCFLVVVSSGYSSSQCTGFSRPSHTQKFQREDLCFLFTLVSSVVSDSLRAQGLQPARLLCPQVSPGKNTGVDCLALLQGILPPRFGTCVSSVSLTASGFLTPAPPGGSRAQLHAEAGDGRR